MRNFWLAFLIVLLLAVILTVGLTVTYLYKEKKRGKDAKSHEIIWSFHLEKVDSNLEGTIEDIINVDILKTIEYEVGDNKAFLRSVVTDFGEVKLTGWIHSFRNPLRVKKILVGKAQIDVTKVVPISGFTVFNKEGNADFVTLWHDDAFHHYSTAGELLTVGAFPFANGDESKHPDKLDLPKEVSEDADLTHGKLPEDVPKAHEDELPKDQKAGHKTEDVDIFRPTGDASDKTVLRDGVLVVDLDLASLSNVGTPHTYKDGNDEITITRITFNVSYEKLTFTLKDPRSVSPHIKYEGTMVDLGCSGISDVSVFVGKNDIPLLASFRETAKIKYFSHRGRNEWQLVSVPLVDVQTLDDIYCFLGGVVVFDFSRQSGSYEVGGFEVRVTETVGSEPFEKFKSFKHTIYSTTKNGSVNVAAKVHKYKFFKVNFNGLNHNDRVTTATAFFWEGDLTKPFLIRLLVDTTYQNYVGYKDYLLEPKAALLQARLERLNYEVNHVLTINLAKQAPYDFKGGLLGTGEEHVAVKIFDKEPMDRFRKCVHTHAASRNVEHFKILRFLGHDYITFESRDVSEVEVYFVKGHFDRPLLFSLKGHFHTHHYFLESGKFVKKDLIFGDLEYSLKHLAYHTLTYLTLDFTKFSPYHFSGESAFPRHRHSHVIVRRNDELDEFVRTTHTLEKVLGDKTNFYVLALKGADIELEDQVVTSVDAYFVERHLDEPLVVRFKGAADRLFVATKTGFEQKDSSVLSNLEKVLRRAAHDKLKLVYLQLHRMSNYYDEHLDGLEVKVEEKTVDLGIDGFKKFIHTFPETKDVRFLLFGSYFDPKVDSLLNLNKAVVITARKDFPVLVSLIDVELNAHFFKYDGDNEWVRARPLDMNQFLMKVNEELLHDEFYDDKKATKVYFNSLYPSY